MMLVHVEVFFKEDDASVLPMNFVVEAGSVLEVVENIRHQRGGSNTVIAEAFMGSVVGLNSASIQYVIAKKFEEDE